MKKYNFTISGQKYEVEIGEMDGDNVIVQVNGTPYDVTLDSFQKPSKTPILNRKPVITKPNEGQVKKVEGNTLYKIVAPLPGSISKINVHVGDTVKVGECVLVMEAMKMENNVSTDKAGVVKSVKTNVGNAVLQGDTLIEIA